MKRLSILLGVLGVGLGIALVVWLGAGKVVHAVTSVGWKGFGILVGWQLLLFIVLAEAWRLVCRHGRFGALVFGCLVREGGTNIMPFSEVGGLVFGARAVMLAGIRWPRAIASSLADVTAEFVGELPFILFGFIMLITYDPHSSLVGPLTGGVGLVLLGAAGLVWARSTHIGCFMAWGGASPRDSAKLPPAGRTRSNANSMSFSAVPGVWARRRDCIWLGGSGAA